MRQTLYFRFTDETAAIAAMPEFRKDDDAGNSVWSSDCIVTGTKDGSSGQFIVSPDKPDGFYLHYLFEEYGGVPTETFEAMPEWIMTATNGYATWTPVRGDLSFIPDCAFA